MRALVCRGYGGVETLGLEARPKPEPGKGEVRVRVTACGANASDWEFVSGVPFYGRLARMMMRKDVFGSDVVGVVEAVGPGVETFQVGQKVVGDVFGSFGGFAEFCVAKAELFVPVAAGVSDVLAAALPQSGTIATEGIRGRVGSGDRVLINGAGGGSGPLAIQLAKAAGAEVWGVDTGEKADVMVEAGADHTLDFEREDFAETGERWDLILDLYGTRSVARLRRALAPGGRYLVVGGPMRRMLAIALWGGLSSLVSDRKVGVLAVNQGPGHLGALMQMVAEGELTPVVGEVTSLDCAAQALGQMGAREIGGKLVIVP